MADKNKTVEQILIDSYYQRRFNEAYRYCPNCGSSVLVWHVGTYETNSVRCVDCNAVHPIQSLTNEKEAHKLPNFKKDKYSRTQALKEIAKETAKTMILQTEPFVMFSETDLNDEDIEYIENCFKEIAESITSKDQATDLEKMVKEYFNKEN